VNPLSSVGARLSLALLLVVAMALGLVYVVVVPQLQNRLVDQKLAQLRRVANDESVPPLSRGAPGLDDFAARAAVAANGRVVVYQYTSPPPALSVQGDSNPVQSNDVANDSLALEAGRTLTPQSGTVERDEQRYAEVAIPTPQQEVVLYSAALHDSLANVHLVQRRLLWAGLAALLLSLLVGYGGASMFTRRIRRLERAAEAIAEGRFDEPVDDSRRDELGQLANAFERMRRRLAQLDRARREFIANASHELRTPLFSLGGFLELLADEELDEATRREFLATMAEQVERLTKLATDLLDLSRLDAGKMRVERTRLDLAELATLLRDELAPVAAASAHPLSGEADEEVAALGDEQRVLQIGRALLENAIRHTPEGTPVRVLAELRDGRPTLEVEDEGPGVPAEQATHLFERFYRLEGTRSSGSGLGLAIARELAELMGGRLELESQPGRTRFTLTLPAAPVLDDAFSRENAVTSVGQ
jgi:signal transduction histidine kinase